MQFVANAFGDLKSDQNKIVLTTYHSAKGLDFDLVYLPFCNHVDEYSHYEPADATLFMVAMTRSRGDLVISYTGELSRFVANFRDGCTFKDLSPKKLDWFGMDNDIPQHTEKTKKDSDLFIW